MVSSLQHFQSLLLLLPPLHQLERMITNEFPALREPTSGRLRSREIELHPGFYVDWDETPDETIGPLANAVGEYVVGLIEAKRGAA